MSDLSSFEQWQQLAEKELKGASSDSLNKLSAEQIVIKPIYSSQDIPEHLTGAEMPGLFPYMRGPYATMYANRPWTIRQYAGFSTAAESNAFYKRNLAAGQKVFLLHSIWQHIGDMIQIILVLLEMLARPELQSIP